MLGGRRRLRLVGVPRVDIAGSSDKLKMESKGPDTRITVPTGMLWLLVFGGIAMLTINGYLMREQLTDHHVRLEHIEGEVNSHFEQPSHKRGSRYLLDLERRVRELESGEVDE